MYSFNQSAVHTFCHSILLWGFGNHEFMMNSVSLTELFKFINTLLHYQFSTSWACSQMMFQWELSTVWNIGGPRSCAWEHKPRYSVICHQQRWGNTKLQLKTVYSFFHKRCCVPNWEQCQLISFWLWEMGFCGIFQKHMAHKVDAFRRIIVETMYQLLSYKLT